MAFGFGFNKQKVLSAAEKCVQQGKLQNAISEYEKILKHDPKDLTVMNTVGDLHARLGENDKAAECFKSVGDAYASQGFTVKAIAMYKKLSKLKASMESVLRLAELYTQQGLFNDARSQYLQVAEEFLKTGQLDQAVKIFEKTLEMDPDNVAMRTKLAEVYVRLGKKPEAWQILSAAAESLRSKGQLAAADEILQRMLKLEPNSSYALLLRGRAALDSNDPKAAIDALRQIADLDNNPEALRSLFQAYLKTRNFGEAGPVASKLANVHDDGAAIIEYADALMEAQQYRDVLQVYQEHSDRLLRNDPGKLIEALRPIVGHVKDDTQALETILALEQKAGENTHLTEIYELLAHAYVQSGELEKARDYYQKLMQLEPANPMHAQNYQQVLGKQGAPEGPRLITSEEGAVLLDELEANAPAIEQRHPDEIALAVRSAMTDAELFTSYNMPAKALTPLLAALPQAPRDLRLNQKVAALQTRAGNFAEAGVCCRTLQSIYHDAGHAEESTQAPAPPMQPAATASEFEIAAPEPMVQSDDLGETTVPVRVTAPSVPAMHKPAGRSGLFFHAPAPPSTTKTQAPVPPAPPAPATPPADFAIAPEPQAPAEADLSSEWEHDLTVEAHQSIQPSQEPAVVNTAEAASPVPAETEAEPVQLGSPAPQIPNLDEAMEEVRFYLGQGMVEQAEQVLVRLEALVPDSSELAVLRLGVESSKQSAVTLPEAEVSMDEPETVEPAPSTPPPAPQPWPQQRPVLQEMATEIEQSLGTDFLAPNQAEPHSGPVVEVTSTDGHEFRSGTLDEFVADLEASLGSDFLPETPTVAESAPARAAQVSPLQSSMNQAPPAARAAAAAAVAPSAPVVPAVAFPPPAQATPAAAAPKSAFTRPVPARPDSGIGVDLSDMFGELKHELEEGGGANEEDPETHYNLGVAFREMGLLDEAIGEFQKVCQSAERGHAFSQLMQTYTWLAQCFLDKGVPEAAVRWYERALKLPNLGLETRTALHYELAASLENAGNKPAALTNFLEVYGNNIDYRDVAERIKALRT
jgi:pilus assembly protein FimV